MNLIGAITRVIDAHDRRTQLARRRRISSAQRPGSMTARRMAAAQRELDERAKQPNQP